MSASEDVKTLFRRFGGEPESYQEVVRERQAAYALGKWAMLGQVDLNHPQTAPVIRKAVKTSASRPYADVPPSVAGNRPLFTPDPVAPQAVTPPAPAVVESRMPAPVPPAAPTVIEAPAVATQASETSRDPAAEKMAAPPTIAVVAAPAVERATEVPVSRTAAPLSTSALLSPTADSVVQPPPYAPRPAAIATPMTEAPTTLPASVSVATAPAGTASGGSLAARWKAMDAPEPDTAAAPSGHSLAGLFGRLSTPPAAGPKPGVLRRKFNR